MTLLSQVRAELVAAMERGPRPWRPGVGPVLVASAVLAAAVMVVVLAWPSERIPSPSPAGTERLAGLPAPIRASLQRKQPGGRTLSIEQTSVARTVDPGGLTWTALGFVSSDMVGRIAAPDRLTARGVGWTSNGPIALALASPPLQANVDGATGRSRLHLLVSGTVDARATKLTVTLAGERRDAALAPEVISAHVPKDAPGLTPEGRRKLARAPDEIRLRAYAAAFTPELADGQRSVQPELELTFADGTVQRTTGARFCIDRSCGTTFPPVP
jgi:hypothetical protein